MRTLGARLWLSFAVIVAIIVASSWSLGRQLDAEKAAMQRAGEAAARLEDDADRMQSLAAGVQRLALEAALAGSKERLLQAEAQASQFFTVSARIKGFLTEDAALPLRDERLAQLQRVDESFRAVMAATLSPLAANLGAGLDLAAMTAPSEAFRVELSGFDALGRDAQRMNVARTGNRLEQALANSSWALALTLAVIALVFWFLRRSIVLRTAELADFVSIAGQNPLQVSARSAVAGDDEVTVLARAVNGLFDRLQRTAVSKDFFDRVIENVGNALFVTDRQGCIRLVNAAAVRMLGVERESLIGFPLGQLLSCARSLTEELPPGTECRLEAAEPIPVGCMRTEIADGYVYVTVDLRERNATQAQLRLAATVIENAAQGLIITDVKGTIIAVNPAFSALTGYPSEEVVGDTPRLLKSGRHEAEFYKAMWRSLESQGNWHGEVWNRRKSGDVFPAWMSMSAVHSASGEITQYIALFSDITERKAQEQRIEFLAFHDALTGLPNRSLLNERLEQAVSRCRRQRDGFAVMFLDLDRFKTINDSLGHAIGDHLLKTVAERLAGCLRSTDTVCRQGGDEFIVILTDLRETDFAGMVAEKILARLADPIVIGPHSITTSFSIGITIFPHDSEEPALLLKNADVAMYHAKQAGRNTFRFYDAAMNIQATQRLAVESGLRRALAEGELLLYYQPQYAIASGRLTGAEALIRWNDPQQGVVLPGAFIPVAEESGLITPIGAWVLREAIRQAAAWEAQGLPLLTIAVNISAIQLRRGRLDESVPETLAEFGVAAGRIELEITESLLVEDDPKIGQILRSLKQLGLSMAIDDFGTGYSSLAYLKRFNVDKLKIDRSFVSGLGIDADSEAIVRAVVNMAHGLGLGLVAEGVETLGQLEILRAIGCDEAQGYYFARPMPVAEFERVLAAAGAMTANGEAGR